MHIEKFKGIYLRENVACVRRERGGVGGGGGGGSEKEVEERSRQGRQRRKRKTNRPKQYSSRAFCLTSNKHTLLRGCKPV